MSQLVTSSFGVFFIRGSYYAQIIIANTQEQYCFKISKKEANRIASEQQIEIPDFSN